MQSAEPTAQIEAEPQPAAEQQEGDLFSGSSLELSIDEEYEQL